MKLLVPAFLLLALGYLATAEVVETFTGKCNKFFANGIPPTGPSGSPYKHICQMKSAAKGYEFATLYDTSRRIPVYSAYKFQKKGSCLKRRKWDIEPQLDDQNGGAIMASESNVNIDLRGQKQALDGDYSQTQYHRGHLVPVLHRNSQSCVDATFTLTNAAPQHRSFNQGQWKKYERSVSNNLTTQCLNRHFSAYIVTGVVPGLNTISGRVNIPSYFWSAYCCIDNNGRPQLSGAYYGYNDFTNRVEIISMASLDAKLRTDYGSFGFQVFSGKCSVDNKSGRPQSPIRSVRNQSPFQSFRPQSPIQSVRPQSPFQSVRPQSPFQLVRPQSPFQSVRPQSPFQSVRPQSPFQLVRPQSPFQSVRPQSPFQLVRPQSPIQSIRRQSPFQLVRQKRRRYG